MKKFFFRTAVLLLVLILSMIFFYKKIEQHTYTDEVLTVEASEAVLPLVSFTVNDNEINLTKGYTVAQDDKYPRDSITPISSAKEFTINIDQKKSSVKKLTAEVFGVPDLTKYSEIEVNKFNTLEDGRLSADLTIEEELTEDIEYLLKVTLTTSLGNQVYYYTRLQVTTFGSLSGSMEFVNNFHTSTFDKDEVYELSDVMEEDDDATINDYSHIDITASLDALSYGEMAPTQVYEIVPLISEYNETYASVALQFWIQAYSDDGLETYECSETFRFQYTSYRIYLYNYDRYMNTLFDGSYFENEENLVKLGIAESGEVDSIYSEDNTQMLFDYQGTLWHLDTTNNKFTEVYTYRDSEDYERGCDDDYGYKLLSIDENGDADFAVYGYLGKGVYEGRTGIIYYSYYAADERIEEKMFIPLDIPYCDMEGEFGTVSYTSDYDIYYFTLFNSYYSYELETNVLKTIVEDMGENWIYFEDENILIYDENPEQETNERIVLWDVANNTETYIEADSGMTINLLGSVDNRIVYGNADGAQVSFFDDGSILLPYNKITIANLDGTIEKQYAASENQYVGNVEFGQGFIGLDLYELKEKAENESHATYTYASRDVIIDLNNNSTTTAKGYTTVNEDVTKLEYYLTLPSSYAPEQNPKIYQAKSTVITKDTTAIIKTELPENYYVTAYGKIVLATDDLGLATTKADSLYGSVVDSNGKAIWQRGIVEEKATVSSFDISYVNDSRSEEQAALQMMMNFYGVSGDATTISMREKSLYEWFQSELPGKTAYTENADLSLILYFVSKGKPVVVSYSSYYVVITSYTEGTVSFQDPVTGEKRKLLKEKASEAFEEAGGHYYIFY